MSDPTGDIGYINQVIKHMSERLEILIEASAHYAEQLALWEEDNGRD